MTGAGGGPAFDAFDKAALKAIALQPVAPTHRAQFVIDGRDWWRKLTLPWWKRWPATWSCIIGVHAVPARAVFDPFTNGIGTTTCRCACGKHEFVDVFMWRGITGELYLGPHRMPVARVAVLPDDFKLHHWVAVAGGAWPGVDAQSMVRSGRLLWAEDMAMFVANEYGG